MKIIKLIIILFFQANLIAQHSDLNVKITNIKEVKGHLEIGVYNNPELFPKVDQQYKVFYIKVTASNMNYTIKGLKHGQYALAIFHDLNSDTICNRNIMGIPTEKYGFSNNVRPFLSAPSFEDAAINLNSKKTIIIQLD